MLKTIKTKELTTGMYIVLSESWIKHPFARSRFMIKSSRQIEKIIESGFDEVTIDLSKSLPLTNIESIGHEDVPLPPAREWEPEKLVPDELREALRNRDLLPDTKAVIVYNASLVLMENLFRDPKTENISEAKKGIAGVVDLIVSDKETSRRLLEIITNDFYTYTHSVNVGILSVMLSKELFTGSDAHDMHELGAGFFLHDIGKTRIDPEIINKQGKLTEGEMEKMRAHPYQGYKLLSDTKHLTEECKVIVMQHHEREDGTGYPMKLKGDDIHLYGRICCIADVYDALTAKRSYKLQYTPFEALKIMKNEMINHFHKEIFEKFVLLLS